MSFHLDYFVKINNLIKFLILVENDLAIFEDKKFQNKCTINNLKVENSCFKLYNTYLRIKKL